MPHADLRTPVIGRRQARRSGRAARRHLLRIEPLEGRSLLAVALPTVFGLGGSLLEPRGVATDDAGDLYITGAFSGTVDFDPGPGTTNLTSNGLRDIFVAKYSPSGALLYAVNFGSGGDERSNGIAIDGAGNAYITGLFSGAVDFHVPNQPPLDIGPHWGVVVVKLNPDGTTNYAVAAPNNAAILVQGQGITVDGNGNAYVTGDFATTTTFGSTPLTATAQQEVFVAKVDPVGNWAWAKSFTGDSGGSNDAAGIAVDPFGNILTTGSLTGSADFDPNPSVSQTLSSVGQNSAWVAKLDAAGNYVYAVIATGLPGSFNSTGTSLAEGIAVDAAGNAYITGLFTGADDFDPGPGNLNLMAPFGMSDRYVWKLDPAGHLAFARALNVPESSLYGLGGIGVSRRGDIFVGTSMLTSENNPDSVLIRLNRDGQTLETVSGGGPGADYANRVAVSPSGNVALFGVYNPPATFGSTTLTDLGLGTNAAFVFVARYHAFSPAGNDFDGDGKTDFSVYRPSTGTWLIANSSNGTPVVLNYGVPNVDLPLSGDFDGDGRTDIAVYRPTTGQWLISFSGGGFTIVSFGAPNLDTPVPGDFDGDGKTDFAVYRPSTGQWLIAYSGGGANIFSFGVPNIDQPVQGDFDGDGKSDIAVYRPTTGTWLVSLSTGGPQVINYGAPNIDKPTPADFDGDGKTDFAVYRPSTGQWLIVNSHDASPVVLSYGVPNVDLPLTGDFDGDGRTDIGVYRPTTGQWLVSFSGGNFTIVSFGAPNVDQAVPVPLSYRYQGSLGTRSFALRSGSDAADVALALALDELDPLSLGRRRPR